MPMKKVCLRCGVTFQCMYDNITQCHCTTVQLDLQQRMYLKENYLDCLCPRCLDEVKDAFYRSGKNPQYIKQKRNDKKSTDSQQG